MGISLRKATLKDAEKLWKMQLESFKEMLMKYQDYDTNPGNEQIDRIIFKLKDPYTCFYFICEDGKEAGAIRIVDYKDNNRKKRIAPLFILPDYQNRGLAQKAIELCEDIHGKYNWELDTSLQEKRNCHLYEKMGYHTIGKTRVINDKLTLISYEK